ncbi:NAD(P)-binding protein [Archangium sp.]|uniref:NAD(P)-binding protein n=1 Tax=Archangium sp. TaxID=1872627 RepID=UPI00286AA8CE|nr:NAD(P)-binding protein [Archangium sp.]
MPVKPKKNAPVEKVATKPTAYVYGGGVAGMTAAHELAIRGFKVKLYEESRALGPRGTLDEPTLGGMARTQYFATTSEQKLYFHVEPLGRLVEQLQQSESWDIAVKRLGDQQQKDAREMVCTFFELFWAFLLSCDDRRLSFFLEALDQVFKDDVLSSFMKSLKKGLKEKSLLAVLSTSPFSLKDFLTRSRQCLKSEYADAAASKKAQDALASTLTSALTSVNRGAFQLECLEAVSMAARSGLLSTVLAFFLRNTLQALLPSVDPLYYLGKSYEENKDKSFTDTKGRVTQEVFDRALASTLRVTQPVQMAEPGGNFPECWLEFMSTGDERSVELLPESEAVLNVAIQYVKSLIEKKQFHTETGKLTDVKILVQSFAAPGLNALRGLTKDEPKGGTLEEKSSVDPRANWLVERIRKAFEGSELQPNSVELYTKTGGFLNTYTTTGFAPAMRDWLRVIFFRPQLPGEHGYRFFPSYYRHVFDTMRRIPLQSAPGRPLGGTVLDNLVPLPEIGIFSERSAPFIMSWTPSPPGAALSRADYNRRNLAGLEISSQDLLQFSLRVLRYMTSSSRRRTQEMEDVSWWDYLRGYEPSTGSSLYRYSEKFKRLVTSSSRALAAFDGENGDARTCGNTYVQLLTQALVPTEYGNCILNGPTTEAWFTHWRRYLEELEVEFHHGELLCFEQEETQQREWEEKRKQGLARDEEKEEEPMRLVARVRIFPKASLDREETEKQIHGAKADDKDAYFVVATDLCSAAAVMGGLKDAMARQLHAYAHRLPTEQGSRETTSRDPKDVVKRQAWDRLQTIAGIQFFFQKHVNVFDGYIYCVDAEWGLSAICSHLVWRERPTGSSLEPYQSILSVDIGDWNKKSSYLNLSAFECTPKQLRDEVLRQLRASLSTREPGRNLDGSVLPEPDWVHIDESLEFESLVEKDRPRKLLRNNAPYLVPIAGDWQHRPGADPWDPSPESDSAKRLPYQAHMWQAAHGGYPVYYGRLVFAGTYLKTFTRMTTMESANESARHAVNAILDHYAAHRAPARQEVWRETRQPGPSVLNPYERGLFPTSPQGDYCRIWDPEQNELPDFELLQQQDDEAVRQGRPHPMDALGLEVLPSLLSQATGARESYDQLLKWVSTAGAAAPQATQGLLAVLRHLRTVLETTPPPRGY